MAIYFCNINLLSFLIIILLNIFKIEAISFDFDLAGNKNILSRFLLKRKLMKRVYISPIHSSHSESIEIANRLVDQEFNNQIITRFNKILKTDDNSLIFKKIILDDIFKFIYIKNYLEKNKKKNKQVLFFPLNLFFIKKKLEEIDADNIINRNVILFKLPIYSSYIFVVKTILLLGIFSIVSLHAFNYLCRRQKTNKNLPTYKYAFAIDFYAQAKFEGSRSFDFIVDNKSIKKEECVFIMNSGIPEKIVNKIVNEGYPVLSVNKNRVFNWSDEYNWITDFSLMRLIFSYKNLTSELKAIYTLINAQFRMANLEVCFDNYIYTNQENYYQIAINSYLKGKECVTWDYSTFLGGAYLYAPTTNHFNEFRHILWAFLNPANFLSMNNLAIDYYKIHYQNVNNYFSIGSLVAELVKNERKNDCKDKLINNLFNKSLTSNSKIISFYDTTFIDSDEGITNYDDFFGFYEDILHLAEKFNNILIIVKPAKPITEYLYPAACGVSFDKIDKVKGIINKVKENNRIYWASDAVDTVSIMAYSDLVVTHCMSTPSCDALASGTKAIWYESGNRHKGVLFDHIPDLIIHGYSNLEKLISTILIDNNSLKYNEYIEKYVKGVVEDYIDGNAVSRVRKLLTANN